MGLGTLDSWNCGFESRRGHWCLSLVSVVLSYGDLRRADHSPRRVLPSVVCQSVIVKPQQRGGPGPLGGGAVAPWKTKKEGKNM